MGAPTFAELLAMPGVDEQLVLGGRIGFMAYHGGALEEATDLIAAAAAERTGGSYYGVTQPDSLQIHIPSVDVTREHSVRLAAFLDHVDVVVTVHGFGRRPLLTSLLLGGSNRRFAAILATHLSAHLPAYDVVTELDRIPPELRGVHPRNPVNIPPDGGVQIELPPRARGASPFWIDWEDGLVPHARAVIDALVAGARAYGAERAP